MTPSIGDGGDAILAGISYGPYREGQAPDGVQPSREQVAEDLHIIAQHWNMIRVYSALGVTEMILEEIRAHALPIRVMLGVWVAPDSPDSPDNQSDSHPSHPDNQDGNEREITQAIRLANTYTDEVFAVCVGNETQVFWSAHRSPTAALIRKIRRVRAAISQPVSTADDYNFWNKPESQAVADEVDFLVLHAYAMWNRQQLDDAVQWTADIVHQIQGHHPTLNVYLGETGWATAVHPSGDAATQIVAPAGEEEQALFYSRFTEWAATAGLPYFYFEAFDEPWKGGPHPDEVEKHWGLFHVDRTPKLAMRHRATDSASVQ